WRPANSSAVTQCSLDPASGPEAAARSRGAAPGGTGDMPFCTNHPTTETGEVCASCGQPFCDACLVTIMGQRLCGPCRDRRVAEMQGHLPGQAVSTAPLAGSGTVDIGRWLSSGWQIVQADIVTFAVATLLLGLIGMATCGILAGPMTCGIMMMAYRRMTSG